jgi:hypothetical protein
MSVCVGKCKVTFKFSTLIIVNVPIVVPRGLTFGSAVARLLGWRVRIPPRA